ncbi:hypothetical protein EZV73_20295 [Acidaminobacter sp. JC074]|uniref:fibrobacter succinogenes major paralogous domain-containing protein n=1 Tax=Acidaminobacter sp. JC074 TaxID=2530199 RepID=UPI001F1006F1|nr:fibrobacter succinogenes major paralogous domain-containing protein [Acidaminobacter sp. JC074]MCH4889932.1 hypothetical protein [Acidaminobacter sp. JC074]
MKILTLLLMVLLLIACGPEPSVEAIYYTDVDGNIYDTLEIEGTVWTSVDLKTIHDLDGEDLTSYEVEGRESRLYNIKMIENLISEGWRLPTSKDWETLMSAYPSIEDLRSEPFNLSYAGMYDFTGVYQWTDTGCLYIGKDGDEISYYFYDGQGNSLKTGNFHPKDGFSIRLVKVKMPK